MADWRLRRVINIDYSRWVLVLRDSYSLSLSYITRLSIFPVSQTLTNCIYNPKSEEPAFFPLIESKLSNRIPNSLTKYNSTTTKKKRLASLLLNADNVNHILV